MKINIGFPCFSVDLQYRLSDNSSNAANNAAPATGKPHSVNLHRVETVNRTGMEPSELPTDAASHSTEWQNTSRFTESVSVFTGQRRHPIYVGKEFL
jgi:hypothetical protein